MVTDVLPLRAIVLQCLLLSVSIAIEAYVLYRMLRTADNQPISPKQSIQYAASIDLLSAVLGWFTVFSFFNIGTNLPSGWTRDVETALLNFLFFNQFSNQSLSFLIVGGFITFFASFIVKQVGLWGLRWLLQPEFRPIGKETDIDLDRYRPISEGIRYLGRGDQERRLLIQSQSDSGNSNADTDTSMSEGIRDLRKDPRDESQLNIAAVLFANAWSYSAILAILLILTL
jgi:hypothetical protein